jgi:hypothetical protein
VGVVAASDLVVAVALVVSFTTRPTHLQLVLHIQ